MNVFGAFTFGALIKTFLPGFVWLAALVLGETQLAPWLGWPSWGHYVIAKEYQTSATVLAVPLSILLGLISNILVFMGINDNLVRKPVRVKNAPLFELFDELSALLRARCWSAIGCIDASRAGAFKDNIDPEQLLLHKIGVSTIGYIREQYWFHLEFQMNLWLSITVLSAALCGYLIGSQTPTRAILIVAVYAFASWVLISAARKNYCRHIEKMASMMAAVLAGADKDPAPAARGWFTPEVVSKFNKHA
ncbi:hypothetical protein RPB_2642 [Rhodopseudomonas palustris HaA2]|uniref:Uncharacterized protein n=1 Tax=Rhodopseudomonas palustris (strain HaA2) TaxID=316058 RepID=Q2IWR6_RHOP2|nr:hypothetical protein [Rhodopseudomonas palustris]ABD07344.1 hypothetical protein RPB_2642 [Rhodopseudomonas palustris HaA2]